MERKTERTIIDRWIDEHGPDGILRLADQSGVSSSTITKARLGYVPRKFRTRQNLCSALEVSEDDLFPLVGARVKRKIV